MGKVIFHSSTQCLRGNLVSISGNQWSISIGVAPWGGPTPIEIPTGSWISGSPGIMGENNVHHCKYDGEVHVELNSPYLYWKRPNELLSLPELYARIGTVEYRLGYLLAVDGMTKVISNPLNPDGGFLGARRAGYVVATFSGSAYQWIWYNKNFNAVSVHRVPLTSTKGLTASEIEATLNTNPGGFSLISPNPGGSTTGLIGVTLPKALSMDYHALSLAVAKSYQKFDMTSMPFPEDSGLVRDAVIRACADDSKYLDINSSMFIRELIEIKKLLPPVRDIKGLLKLSPKSIANVYLWYRYGVRLTVSDLLAIRDALRRVKKDIKQVKPVRYRNRQPVSYQMGDRSWISGYHSGRLLLNQLPLEYNDVLSFLNAFDLEPSWLHAWDFVPYSFVVDWLLPIGNFLGARDLSNRITSLPILAYTSTWKLQRDVLTHGEFTPIASNLRRVWYMRTVTSQPSVPLMSWTPSTGGVERIFDFSALVTQRI